MVSSIGQMTFSKFIENICSLPREKLDEHFRPQVDFLALENYSQWFCLENFSAIENRLKSDIGFILHDTRNKIGHDSSGHLKVEGDFLHASIADLRELKKLKKLPAATSLYTSKTIKMAADYFSEDVKIYTKLFGGGGMLF